MALEPGSEHPDLGAPEDYAAHHPSEHPSEWGWHGEWGRWARVGGWVTAAILLLMISTTHYNGQGTMWLIIFTAAIVVTLVWDISRRRTSWRQ